VGVPGTRGVPDPLEKGRPVTTKTATPLPTALRTETKRWSWLWLISGALWTVVSLIILQFDLASAATVGVIAGVMFVAAGVEYFFLGSMMGAANWLSYLFGGLLIVGGAIALFYPTRTFLTIASILGYMFAAIGIMWLVEGFLARDYTDLWWLKLVAGILMIVQGFWLSGQFLITQAATLLIFAGIWAMMRGFLDITAFFTLRSAADAIATE
jgi:uncharacterized membrane protein HdeD (DUF308 family)